MIESFWRCRNNNIWYNHLHFHFCIGHFLLFKHIQKENQTPLKVVLYDGLIQFCCDDKKRSKLCNFQVILIIDEKIRWTKKYLVLYLPQYLLFPNIFLSGHKLVPFILKRNRSCFWLSFALLPFFFFIFFKLSEPEHSVLHFMQVKLLYVFCVGLFVVHECLLSLDTELKHLIA